MERRDVIQEKGRVFLKEHLARWAKAVIVAEFIEYSGGLATTCGPQAYILACSKHTRTVFSEMRKAVRSSGLQGAQHLGRPGRRASTGYPVDERRTSGGYYLKLEEKGFPGWRVRKLSLEKDLAQVEKLAGQENGWKVAA